MFSAFQKQAIFVLLFCLASSFGISQVAFVEKPFEELVKQAKDEQKLVMVDAYTDWCGWCKVMDRETFSDSVVGDYMNPKFVSTKINMEEGFGIKLAAKYRISSYPQYLFFDGDGHLIQKLVGFIESKEFIEKLEPVVNLEDALPPLPEPLNFTMDYPEFYLNSFKKRKDRSYPSYEEVQAFLKTRSDLTDEVSWGVISRFIKDGEFANSVIENKDALIKKYGESEVNNKLASFVFNDVKAAIKDNDEMALETALNKADEILGDESESYKFRYKLYFYQMTERWSDYTAMGELVANNSDQFDPATLNQIAWSLYENDENQENLLKATAWMKRITEAEPSYAYLDTYAALLYKTTRYEDARKAAEKAIAIAEENGENADGTKKLLEQIKSAL